MDGQGKVLIVDDHRALAENLAEIVELAGYDAIAVESAEAALDCLDGEPIVAVITDYRLPGRTGAELIEELRRRGKGFPVFVMSAFADVDTVAYACKAGARDVVDKPIEIGHILSFVAELRLDSRASPRAGAGAGSGA
jgi:DNA-binding NtrC family response regulator